MSALATPSVYKYAAGATTDPFDIIPPPFQYPALRNPESEIACSAQLELFSGSRALNPMTNYHFKFDCEATSRAARLGDTVPDGHGHGTVQRLLRPDRLATGRLQCQSRTVTGLPVTGRSVTAAAVTRPGIQSLPESDAEAAKEPRASDIRRQGRDWPGRPGTGAASLGVARTPRGLTHGMMRTPMRLVQNQTSTCTCRLRFRRAHRDRAVQLQLNPVLGHAGPTSR
jgi:hypothetical protein